ncbi:MAG: U32 family peptidase [Bacteroides sp.]|nr:U32 family peptidase [Eubacterium sp.]MCM1417243.1 U32 family peptidase [Roseburia sp.]MCM1461137.1 U32 family peptidase [Bacteroides sp.]
MAELLSPAGEYESLEAAVDYGCDAVYLGGQAFGMRANPKNFDPEELSRAVAYAHKRGVKVYLTCNTVPTNDEIALYPRFIRSAADAGIDAAIVADLGVLSFTKKYAPDLEIHMSTQVGVMNYETANELYRLGAKRVVLAREVSLDELRKIRKNTPPELELEVFVHGAMCVSFSGRCLLSKYLAKRDANRGECAQPCRWKYYLTEETRPGERYEIAEDDRGSYILNARDLCMIEHLPALLEAGADSLKIEGRAKSAYYTAIVTNAYRCALDHAIRGESAPKWTREEVDKVSHRPYCTGFFFDREDAAQYYESSRYFRDCDFVGTIEGCSEGKVTVIQRNYFTLDDELEILSPGRKPIRFTPTEMYNEKGEKIHAANHAMERITFPIKADFPKNSILRKPSDNERKMNFGK